MRLLLWWGPGWAWAAGIFLGMYVDPALRTWIGTPALGVMGLGCLWNAARCGRLHCYFTGPFLLLMAALWLLEGLGRLPLHWGWLALVTVVGNFALNVLPERLWGTYCPRRDEGVR